MTSKPVCAVEESSGQCPRTPVITSPLELCRLHSLEVAAATLPEFLSDSAREQRFVHSEAHLLRPLPARLAEAKAVRLNPRVAEVHDPVVYFVQNGNRMKIGFTKSLVARLAALCLPRESVVLTLLGGQELETVLHTHFAPYRVPGTEWFATHGDLTSYIASKEPEDDMVPAHRPPRPRAELDRARKAVRARIDELVSQGRRQVRPRDFKPLLAEVGRSPAWMVFQFKDLVNEGVLLPGARGVYLIPDDYSPPPHGRATTTTSSSGGANDPPRIL